MSIIYLNFTIEKRRVKKYKFETNPTLPNRLYGEIIWQVANFLVIILVITTSLLSESLYQKHTYKKMNTP